MADPVPDPRPRRSRFVAVLTIGPLIDLAGGCKQLAELTGLPLRTVHRRKQTGLSLEEADRCAAAVGCHPCELWACWFDLADEERRRSRAAYRRRYRRTPKGRDVERRAAKKYAQSAREYENLYQQRWRDANREHYRALQRAGYQRNRERVLAAKRGRYRAKKAA